MTLNQYKANIEAFHIDLAYLRDELKHTKREEFCDRTNLHRKMDAVREMIAGEIIQMRLNYPDKVLVYKGPDSKWGVSCENSIIKFQEFDTRTLANSFARAWRKIGGTTATYQEVDKAWNPYNL